VSLRFRICSPYWDEKRPIDTAMLNLLAWEKAQ